MDELSDRSRTHLINHISIIRRREGQQSSPPHRSKDDLIELCDKLFPEESLSCINSILSSPSSNLTQMLADEVVQVAENKCEMEEQIIEQISNIR